MKVVLRSRFSNLLSVYDTRSRAFEGEFLKKGGGKTKNKKIKDRKEIY